MSNELSHQSEEFLAKVIAEGLFPSKEAALEAAVSALREKFDDLPMVPEEHMEAVERAIEQLDAGLGVPWDLETEKRRLYERLASRQKGRSA